MPNPGEIIEVENMDTPIPAEIDWVEVQKSRTREAIVRASSYVSQSLIVACGAGLPLHISCTYDLVGEVEKFIVEKLREENGV